MDQRNLVCTNQTSDLERNHQHNQQQQQQPPPHLLPDPSFLSRSMPNIPMSQPIIHTVLPAGSSSTNYNLHHHPSIESGFFYGMMPYHHDVHHHHPAGNLNLGAAAIGSSYYPFMAASRPFQIHQNLGSPDQLPSSSNHAAIGVPMDDYGRINHFVDGPIGPFKRKGAEGGIVSSNIQYFGSMAAGSSSAAVAPVPLEAAVAPVPTNALSFPDYSRVNRNVSGGIELDLAMARNNNNHLMTQPNYISQNTNPPPMLEQLQFGRTSIDGGPLTWNQAPGMNYFPGSNGGFLLPGCQDVAPNRTFFHLSPPPPLPNVHHPPPLPLMGVRSHTINFHSQLPAVPSLRPTNSPPAAAFTLNPLQTGNIEPGPRFLGPAVPPSGFRIYRPLRRALVPETNPRYRNLPNLRVLPADEVAMLEISGYYEVGSSVDQHSDMRLDIDHMTYEELLALGEQIGHVGTGLSEETITRHLKTRTPPKLISKACPNQEAASVAEIATDFCVVCQNDYKKQEKIGGLECGHEYHVECIKKWLLVKNTCPICKAPALTIHREEEEEEEEREG
ncbi:probable E3 ubiquitin-protein ligase ZFP1 [Impatiens glandulifera]|uniref:probable E3 ubiquitin-protein ligase ZFP1 n=1 Tax=Impatiens glandulifera TaxID=253017 RepID=UPI001FB08927|nr:probable E3 ubiquitin-protein ligase ZFP1 [Impatiens glandulifera]